VTVATVKRYLVDPAMRICLHDLVFDQVERVYREAPALRIPVNHSMSHGTKREDWLQQPAACNAH
jgi:hypothetical protein